MMGTAELCNYLRCAAWSYAALCYHLCWAALCCAALLPALRCVALCCATQGCTALCYYLRYYQHDNLCYYLRDYLQYYLGCAALHNNLCSTVLRYNLCCATACAALHCCAVMCCSMP